MPTLRYVGPIDQVEIPGVAVLKRGDEFEVSDELAVVMLQQPDNFSPVADAMDVMTIDELKALADERGVDLTGLTKKSAIVAAIKKG